MKRRYSAILLIIVLGGIIFVFYPAEKKRIRKVINKTEIAIKKEDIKGLMENISYNYTDDYGNNYLLLKRRVEEVFRMFDDIEIEKQINKIHIDKKNAEAMLSVRVIATDRAERGYIFGDAVDSKTIRIYLEKTPYTWKIEKVDLMLNN